MNSGTFLLSFVVLAGCVVLYLVLTRKTSPKATRVPSSSGHDLEERIRPLLDKYYREALAYNVIKLADQRGVNMRVMDVLQADYGSVPPEPYVDWNILFDRSEDRDKCLPYQKEIAAKAIHDAARRLEEAISDAETDQATS